MRTINTKKRSIKMISPGRQSYRIALVDIDDSIIFDTVKAYSFEDALIRIKAKFKGYGIQSVEVV